MPNNPILEEVFKTAYDSDQWKSIVKAIFPAVEMNNLLEEELSDSMRADARKVFNYGHVTLADNRNIVFYEVELQDGKSITRNRVGLRNLLQRFILEGLVDGIIATYYNKKSAD